MARYHLNKNGDPGVCSAKPGNCPFGGEEDHFTSAESARAAFEALSSESANSDPRAVAKTYGIGTAATAGYTLAGYTTVRLQKSAQKLKGNALAAVREELGRRGYDPDAAPATPAKTSILDKKGFLWKDPANRKEFEAMILATVPKVEDSKVIDAPAKIENTGQSWAYVGGKAQKTDAAGKRIYTTQAEASAGIREAVKEAKVKGELPSWISVSSTKNSGAWVSSISVTGGMRRKVDGKVRAIPKEWLYDDTANDSSFTRRGNLTEAGERLSSYLTSISRQWETSSGDIFDNYSNHNGGRFTWREKWEDEIADERKIRGTK